MNGKYRIHEMAKDLHINSKLILDLLETYGITARNNMHTLDDDQLNYLFDRLTDQYQSEDLQAIFRAQLEKAAAEKAAAEKAAAEKAAAEKAAAEKAAAEKAAELVRTGVANCLMKGGIQTGTLMKVLLNKETGIEKKGVMTMMALMQSPYYHKVFALTDIGLLTYPDVNQKKAAIENAVNAFHKLGVDMPKVAVLAAVEKENPKMKETVDAQLLKNMDIDGCYVEGPISFDLAMDPNAAAIKGYSSCVAGDADILLVPDICSGNIAAKTLTCCGGAETCGAVLGAQVPIVISSRSAPVQDKYMSIILNALIS